MPHETGENGGTGGSVVITDPTTDAPPGTGSVVHTTGTGGGGGGGIEGLPPELADLYGAIADTIRANLEAINMANQLAAENFPAYRTFFQQQSQLAIHQVNQALSFLPVQTATLNQIVGELATFGLSPGEAVARGLAPPGWSQITGPSQGQIGAGRDSFKAVLRQGLGEYLNPTGDVPQTGAPAAIASAFTAAGLPVNVEGIQAYLQGAPIDPATELAYYNAAAAAGIVQPLPTGQQYIGPNGETVTNAREAWDAYSAQIQEPGALPSMLDSANEILRRFMAGDVEGLTPQQQEQIDTIYGAAEEEAFANLTQFTEELAAARGLRTTDTPIADVSVREAANLSRDIGAAKAATELGQANQNRGFLAGLAGQQQAFQTSIEQFQQNLRANAIQSRAAIAAGLVPGITPPSFGGAGGGGEGISAATGLIGQFLSNQQSQAALAQNQAQFASSQAQQERQFRNPVAPPPRNLSFIDFAGPFANLVLAGSNIFGGAGAGAGAGGIS